MEEGVYVYKYRNSECNQLHFVNVKRNGTVYGRKAFVVKKICFTFANPELIFPVLKEGNKSKEYKDSYAPLLINNSTLVTGDELLEDTLMYNFIKENYVKCEVSFRLLEHLYENYISIRKTTAELIEELNS